MKAYASTFDRARPEPGGALSDDKPGVPRGQTAALCHQMTRPIDVRLVPGSYWPGQGNLCSFTNSELSGRIRTARRGAWAGSRHRSWRGRRKSAGAVARNPMSPSGWSGKYMRLAGRWHSEGRALQQGPRDGKEAQGRRAGVSRLAWELTVLNAYMARCGRDWAR